jgi:putative phosphoesterase
MQIGLIADTHVRELTHALPCEIIEAFKDVNLILHAGDIYAPSLLDELEQIAPVMAVSGDDDYGAILTDKRVKLKHTLYFEGKTIWLAHKNPCKQFYKSPPTSNTAEQLKSGIPDIVIFGHTHYSTIEEHNGILFINPGSPFNHSHKLGTVALLYIDANKVHCNVLDLGVHSSYFK